jgi:anti-sigma regulatory factor (Ser/Thr protein kinase)
MGSLVHFKPFLPECFKLLPDYHRAMDELIVEDTRYARVTEVRLGYFEITKKPPYADIPAYDVTDAEYDRKTVIEEMATALFYEVDLQQQLQAQYDRARDPRSRLDIGDMFVEPIINAEMHGNNYELDKKVKLQYRIHPGPNIAVVSVQVEDEGKGFDYREFLALAKALPPRTSINTVRTPTHPDSLGYGLVGLLSFCDTVSWNDKGNIITLTKTLQKIS